MSWPRSYSFFFNDTATTEIYTLSLHDALPISFLARSRTEDMRHEKANFHRREKFARALSLSFGEFAQEGFVAVAKKIRLHVVQAKPAAGIGKRFDHPAQGCVGDFALAVARLVVVHNINHASERRIVLHDGTNGRGELFAERLRLFSLRPLERLAVAHHRPARLRWNVKANKRMIVFQNFEGGLAVAV